jgi:hypothetical protein
LAWAKSGTDVTETTRLLPSRELIRKLSLHGLRSRSAIPGGNSAGAIGCPSRVSGWKSDVHVSADISPASGERSTENLLGRLVVEVDSAVRVGDEHRCRELRGELAREDQDKVLLAGQRFFWRRPSTVRASLLLSSWVSRARISVYPDVASRTDAESLSLGNERRANAIGPS